MAAPPNIPASCKPTAATALNRELDDHVSSVDKRLAAVSEVSISALPLQFCMTISLTPSSCREKLSISRAI